MLLQGFDVAIEARFREKRAAYERLTGLQARYLLAATWLYEGRSGEAAAIDSLLRLDPSMKSFLPVASQPTVKQWDIAEAALVERLDRISGMIDDLGHERATYLATHRELAELRINMDQRIKVARDAVVVWG